MKEIKGKEKKITKAEIIKFVTKISTFQSGNTRC